MFELTDPIPDHTTVAVLGLGASGQAACKLLGLLGKSVVASDARDTVDAQFGAHVSLRLGGNEIDDATAVVLSPGLNPEWPENRDNPMLQPLWKAVESGAVAVWSEIELAIAAANLPTLTVGGTDGKSTTAAMVRDLCIGAGETVLFGGNSWTALSEVLVQNVADNVPMTCCVAEVSAFQLWEGHRLHPKVALLTNIAPDHLDHYADEEGYVQAKRHVLTHLQPGDHAVVYDADSRLRGFAQALSERGVAVHGYGLETPQEGPYQRRAWVSSETPQLLTIADGDHRFQVPADALLVPGTHNRKNAIAALLGVRALAANPRRLEPKVVAEILRNFKGLPHRLAPVRERNQVLWLNDSKATNIHAAVTGLRALERPVIAIVGGVDKRLDLAPLFDALDDVARHAILIGDLAERFQAEQGARAFTVERAATMDEAVQAAARAAVPGDVVSLSPGCSSFDMFRSFEHRGDVFTACVNALP